ncbi:MAG: hypothetical protein ABI599_08775 [Flavobacteriales bacterium]
MKQLRTNRFAAVLSALLLLVAAVAPAICRTTCTESGRSTVDVGHVKSCCDNEMPSSSPEFRLTCCVHTEASAQVNVHTVNAPMKMAVPLPMVAVPEPAPEAILSAPIATLRADRPPPLKAPERLSLNRSLLL